MKILYNLALILLLIAYLPKAIYQRLRHGKYRHSLPYRLGFKMPEIPPTDKPIIWMHCCSVGETKAASTLAPYFKDHALIISSITETGHDTAKKLIPAHAHIYLPFDFSWTMWRLFKNIRPKMLIFVESDFWLNLMSFAKCKTVLVSGTLSERSMRRFRNFPIFTKRLFSKFDRICVQNELYQLRFNNIGQIATVTGNLKMDMPTPPSKPEDFAITVGSTHPGEEEAILKALAPLQDKYEQLKVYIVPRHPERFTHVEKLLKDTKAIPILEMGVLQSTYAKSKLAIVGGSFIGNVGGHNILEPIFQHIPVLFGPQMHKQTELKDLIEKAGAGKQVELSNLTNIVEKYIISAPDYDSATAAAKKLDTQVRGVAKRTYDAIM